MDKTTISISKKFRDWLNTKGRKSENYEEIIKKLLRPEALAEYNKLSAEQVTEKPHSNEKQKESSDIIDTLFEGKLE